MSDYLITIEVRVRVTADSEETALTNASVGVMDAPSAERLKVEWLGQDVISCIKDSV